MDPRPRNGVARHHRGNLQKARRCVLNSSIIKHHYIKVYIFPLISGAAQSAKIYM
jgi:hypothetical protein